MSEPSDPAEREADRIAKDLFSSSRRPEPVTSGPAPAAQRAPNGGGSPPAGQTSLAGARGKGGPLPPSTRNEMEGALGTDFSSVRIHTDAEAGRLSRGMRAQAFTYGDHIFFDEGAYDPESTAGKELIAHELVHTVQQREAVATFARQGGGRSILGCVNDNLSAAGVASWLIGIVGGTCGLIFGIAGSPTGPGAAGTAAFGAALCISGVIGFSVGAVLGVISGCWSDPANFRSRGAYLSSAAGAGAPGADGPGAGAPGGAAGSGAPPSSAAA